LAIIDPGPEVTSRTLVVILGMHRSGTSALTRGLRVLGVDLGDSLIEGRPGNNDKGFWEDSEINAFNDALLEHLGSRWDRLAELDARGFSFRGTSERKSAALAMMERKVDGANGLFGFKDPRTCILLPFWRDVFDQMGMRVRYVIALRNPFEVAASLSKRDSFPEPKGLLLWAKYCMAAIRETEGESKVFCAYDRLLDNPERELRRIGEALHLSRAPVDSKSNEEYANQFLVKQLRHHTVGEERLSDPAVCPPLVDALYRFMNDAAHDKFKVDGAEYRRRWKDIEAQYATSRSLFASLDVYDSKLTTSAQTARPVLPLGPRLNPVAGKDSSPVERRPLKGFEVCRGSNEPLGKLVEQWNLESLFENSALEVQAGKALFRGWVLARNDRQVHVALRQGGVCRSYPLTEPRPDVLDAVSDGNRRDDRRVICGFHVKCAAKGEIEFGFEIDGTLAWAYNIELE
jgi:hypothetical protein